MTVDNRLSGRDWEVPARDIVREKLLCEENGDIALSKKISSLAS
jgi:hypothetical protein